MNQSMPPLSMNMNMNNMNNMMGGPGQGHGQNQGPGPGPANNIGGKKLGFNWTSKYNQLKILS